MDTCRAGVDPHHVGAHHHGLHIGSLQPSTCLLLQDKAQVLSDVRSIIAEQLGTDLEKVRVAALRLGWLCLPRASHTLA